MILRYFLYLVRYIFNQAVFCFSFYVPYFVQQRFICRPSDSTLLEDAEFETRTVATWHWRSDALTTQLYLIHCESTSLGTGTVPYSTVKMLRYLYYTDVHMLLCFSGSQELSVLRIRDVYPGFRIRIFPSRIPDLHLRM